MCQTIPTYYLYGLDAIAADVIVQRDGVRVVERRTGRTLVERRLSHYAMRNCGCRRILVSLWTRPLSLAILSGRRVDDAAYQ
jgi:hypothetical protein